MPEADGSIVLEVELEGVSQAEKKIKQLKDDMKKWEEELKENKAQKKAIANTLADLDDERKKLKVEYERISAAIDEGTGEATESMLADIKSKINANDENTKEIVAAFEKSITEGKALEGKIKDAEEEAGNIELEQHKKKIDEAAAALDRYKENAEIADQSIADMNNELEALLTKQKELEGLGLGLGFKEYDGVVQNIAAAKSKMKQYKDELITSATAAKEAASSTKNIASEASNTADEFAGANNAAKSLEGTVDDKVSSAMESLNQKVEKFGKRLKRLVASAFVFNVISRGLSKLVSWMGKAIAANSQTSAAISRLKSALYTLIYPIYNYIIPAITAFINILADAIAKIAEFVASLFGMSLAEAAAGGEALAESMSNTADATGDAEKAQNGYLSGLDQINRFSDEDTSATGLAESAGSGLSFDWMSDSLTDQVKDTINKIITIGAALCLALGIILTFSGANILLGLGLIVIGAVLLAYEIAENWGLISEMLRGEIGIIFAIVSGALIVLGIILICTGVALPLGIALLIAGAAGLVTTVAVNWDAITEWVGNVIDKIKEKWNAFKDWWKDLWNGIKDFFKGIWDGIKDGAANVWGKIKGVFSSVSHWFKAHVVEPIKAAFNSIGMFFKGILNGIISAFEKAINFFIRATNKIIGGVNTIIGKAANFVGIDWSGISAVSEITLPRLATGAVIPPNKEFLAVLGDQRSGTNIEAPESLIRQIMREELAKHTAPGNGSYTFTAQINRRTLFEEIIKESKLQQSRTGQNPFLAIG